MPSFPSFPFKSDIVPLSEIKVDRSDGSTLRGQDLSGEDTYRIEASWPRLTKAQVTSIQVDFEAARNSKVQLTANDDNLYEGIWRQEPEFRPLGGYFTGKTTIECVRLSSTTLGLWLGDVPDVVWTYNLANVLDLTPYLPAATVSISKLVGPADILISGLSLVYTGSRTDSAVVPIQIRAFSEANQNGSQRDGAVFNIRLRYATPAVLYYPGFGWATAGEGTLKRDGGIEGEEGATCEITSCPDGWTCIIEPGGTLVVDRPVGEAGNVGWRYEIDGNVTTGQRVYT